MRQSEDIRELYISLKKRIKERLREFEDIRCLAEEKILFTELVFCLLTPQSKARNALNAVNELEDKKLLLSGTHKKISHVLKKHIRFHNNKARYIIEARNFFIKKDKYPNITAYFRRMGLNIRRRNKEIKSQKKEIHSLISLVRDNLVKDIKGFGYKEASHFLRNIGFGDYVAILDRHILKNILDDNSRVGTLSKSTYFLYENKFFDLCKKFSIPPSYFDFILWYRETGDIIK